VTRRRRPPLPDGDADNRRPGRRTSPLDLGNPDPRLADLELKIDQAEAIVLDYLKVDAGVLDGSPPAYATGSPPLWTARNLKVISSAILLVLSALYDDEIERTLGDYMKRDGVIPLLLARLRDPALASSA
jgi:hypothetical protein